MHITNAIDNPPPNAAGIAMGWVGMIVSNPKLISEAQSEKATGLGMACRILSIPATF